MVASSLLELRRRSAAERRALELLRGGRPASLAIAPHPDGPDRSFRSAGDERRKRLRELALVAMRHGFSIQPPKAAYVHLEELRLLHLIADAQAGTFDDETTEPVKSAVREAAATLAMIGIDLTQSE